MGLGLGVVFVVVLAVLAMVRPKEAPRATGPDAGTRTVRVDALLAGLASLDTWDAGEQALRRAVRSRGLAPGEVIALLYAIVEVAPLDDAHDAQALAMDWLADVEPDDAYVPVLEAIIPRLRAPARASAFSMLVRRIAGVDAFLRLVPRDPSAAITGVRRLRSRRVATTAAQRDGVLALASSPELVDEIAHVALEWTSRAVIGRSVLALRTDALVQGYRNARARLAAARAARSADLDDAAMVVGVYLDLFGYLAPAAVAGELDAAAKDPDPAIAVFAVASMRRGGRMPSAAVLDAIVRHDRARWVLWELLGAADREALIPPEWRTQEAMARVALAHWLSFPSELGVWPDEMELMKVVAIDAGDGAVLDLYVFRFRMKPPHRTATRGWLAGVAGPYLRGAPPTLGGASTFSAFEPADSRTAEEHVGRVEEILADWRAAQRR